MNIVYSLGIDESGKYYSIEEHEYNIGSAYSFATEYFILEDSEVKELSWRARVRGNSEK